jgi:hypothetical protein
MLKANNGKWHIDRVFSLGVALALVIQIVGIVWWSAKLDARVCILEQHFNKPSMMATLNKSWIDENKDALKNLPALVKQLEINSKMLELNQTLLRDIHTRLVKVEKNIK